MHETSSRLPLTSPFLAQGISFPLQPLQFEVDARWTLLTLNRPARDYFTLQETSLVGNCLRSLLTKVNPSWKKSLPHSLDPLPEGPFFLAWPTAEEHGSGWEVRIFSGKETFFLTLTPSLAPEVVEEVPEEGLSLDPVGFHQTLRRLFRRLQQQEMRFSFFVRHLPGAHFVQNRDLSFTSINEPMRQLLGPSAVNRLKEGESWWEWVHPSDLPAFNQSIRTATESRVPVSFRFRLLLPDQEKVLYLMDLRTPVRGLNGSLSGFEGLWLDLTREEVAQKRLQQAAWKETLAEVSGSLSHDFNNVLTGICSLSELLAQDEELPSRHQENAKLVRDASFQAQALIKRIIGLNREQSGEIGLHDLQHIVRDQKDLIRIILPKDARFELTTIDQELPVRVDPVALRRILINFATNSRDALRPKGRVELLIRIIDLRNYPRQHIVSSSGRREGMAAELIFRDNGTGIPPAILDRIFGPYFSTKGSAYNSGLGLYTVTQFAKENKIDFGVRSVEGMGTDMILLIPLEDIESEAEIDEDTGWIHPNRKTDVSRIGLFGQQDTLTEKLIHTLLQRGYPVSYLPDTDSALKWIEENCEHPSVFITSMDHTSQLSRRICGVLDFKPPTVFSLLALKAVNPDRFNSQLGKAFDAILTDGESVSECVDDLLKFLNIRSLGA